MNKKALVIAKLDEVIKNMEEYITEFDYHLKGIEVNNVNRTKVLEAKMKAEKKLIELRKIRAWHVKYMDNEMQLCVRLELNLLKDVVTFYEEIKEINEP